MSLGDSSRRTSSVWLAFVTGDNALDSQNCFTTSHIPVVGWVITLSVTTQCLPQARDSEGHHENIPI